MQAVMSVVEHPCCARCSVRTRYVRDIADLMGLRDWAVIVEHDPADDGNDAQVRIPEGRREVHVSFCAEFDLLEPDAQRHAVVHELVHPHLASVWSAVMEGAHEAFGGIAFRVYTQTVRREVERSVDALAAVVAMHMPEPPW